MSPSPDPIMSAYAVLVGTDDPAAVWLAHGAVDARWTMQDYPGGAVVRGPGDLVEPRHLVERVTGPGSWPAPPEIDGEVRRCTVDIARPADVMRLVIALQDEIKDHGSMWRTWKTTVEAIAAAAAALKQVTVEAVLATKPS